jgi:hypothetical protein
VHPWQRLHEAHCAVAKAVQGSRTWKQRRLAEREAILMALERNGLVTRTRGRQLRDGAKPDDVL